MPSQRTVNVKIELSKLSPIVVTVCYSSMPSQRTVNIKNYLSKLSPDCCDCLLLQYAESENCKR